MFQGALRIQFPFGSTRLTANRYRRVHLYHSSSASAQGVRVLFFWCIRKHSAFKGSGQHSALSIQPCTFLQHSKEAVSTQRSAFSLVPSSRKERAKFCFHACADVRAGMVTG